MLDLLGGATRQVRSQVRVQGSGFRVQGSEFRVQGSRVQGTGFRVEGAGCRVQGSGFRVQGSGFWVQGPFRSTPPYTLHTYTAPHATNGVGCRYRVQGCAACPWKTSLATVDGNVGVRIITSEHVIESLSMNPSTLNSALSPRP